jgi:catechol 2,3-dioxygenase
MDRPIRVGLVEQKQAGELRDTAVSHIGFRVPDVRKAERFYSRVLGLVRVADLADGGVRLGWGIGHHVIDLQVGEQGLDHYGFEVGDTGGINALRARFDAAGIAYSELDPSFLDAAFDESEGISALDPAGTPVHFHGPVNRQGENGADPGRRPIKYQHITLGTSDVGAMLQFFGVAGFRITDQLEDGRFCWLRSNRDHHTLAIVNVGHDGDIDHYSYDLAEWEDFKVWCDRLTDLDVEVQWGPGRHGPGNNLFVFFDDPAGNHIELSAEMEKFHDDRVTYVPRRWEPIPHSVNLWGGQLPTWRKTSETRRP